MNKFATEQESFWAGEFGDAYVDRTNVDRSVATKAALFSRILARTSSIGSVLELGANVGLNMLALRTLLPHADLHAVEINEKAFERLSSIPGVNARRGSLLDPHQGIAVDLSFTAGVLIHINPDRLVDAYARLYESSHRYVAIAEYYNPTPVEVTYRGHTGRLFKRDFAGEMMERYPDLSLVDYGFVYRRDPVFPQDDLTWFLMESRG